MAKKNRNTGSENPEDESNFVSPQDYQGDEDTGHTDMNRTKSAGEADFEDIGRYGNGNQSLNSSKRMQTSDKWFSQSATSRSARMRFNPGSGEQLNYNRMSSSPSRPYEGRHNEERYYQYEQRPERYSRSSGQEYNYGRDQYSDYNDRSYGQRPQSRDYDSRSPEYGRSYGRSENRDDIRFSQRNYNQDDTAHFGRDYGDFGSPRYSNDYNDNQRNFNQDESRYQRNPRRGQY